MDWKSIIHDLLGRGMKQADIAQHVGLSQPSINDLLHGRSKSVKWEVGEKLRELHGRYSGCKHPGQPPEQAAAETRNPQDRRVDAFDLGGRRAGWRRGEEILGAAEALQQELVVSAGQADA